MSEEIAQAAGDLDYWRRQVEQSIAQMREAAELANALRRMAAQATRERDAALAAAAALRQAAGTAIEAWAEIEDPLPIDLELSALAVVLGSTDASATLLAELTAARALIADLRSGAEQQSQSHVDVLAKIDAYDQAVRGGKDG